MAKICTSVEQSKKLAEILPLESADMFYKAVNETQPTVRLHSYGHIISDKDVPCWSLAALLDVLPKRIEIVDNVYELGLYFYGLYYWNIVNGSICFEFKNKDNLVDACVAMIKKLHELNLL